MPRINRQNYYHTQEINITSAGLSRSLIRLPREEFDLITGFGIIETVNPNNELYKIGLSSDSKEFINLVPSAFFMASKEVAPDFKLKSVWFNYHPDNRIHLNFQTINNSLSSPIAFTIIVMIENSETLSQRYQHVYSQGMPSAPYVNNPLQANI